MIKLKVGNVIYGLVVDAHEKVLARKLLTIRKHKDEWWAFDKHGSPFTALESVREGLSIEEGRSRSLQQFDKYVYFYSTRIEMWKAIYHLSVNNEMDEEDENEDPDVIDYASMAERAVRTLRKIVN